MGRDYAPTSSLEDPFDNLANIVGILNNANEGIVGALATSPRWRCAMEEVREERRFSASSAVEE